MYTLPPSDYTIADIERFCQLTLRRGSPLASIRKSPDDERVVLGAWCLGLPEHFDENVALDVATRFLKDEGQWIRAEPGELLSAALKLGLIQAADGGFDRLQKAREGVSRHRLIDEIESAQTILVERQQRVREFLSDLNRSVNSKPKAWARPENDEKWMALALAEAQKAADMGEVPVGAVLVAGDKLIARAGNRTRAHCDPTAHAEVLVLREGAKALSNYRLEETTLYVTLEPCPMCAGAIVQARVPRVVFAAGDTRMGAMGGAFDLFEQRGLNHHPLVCSGCYAEAAQGLLTRFFADKRNRSDKHE